MKSAVIHVGVNVSNTEPILMVLPVFEDYSFIFVPIPSEGEGTRYFELRNTLSDACKVIEQAGFSGIIEVHNDPEFVGYTFGEGPRKDILAALRPSKGVGNVNFIFPTKSDLFIKFIRFG
ncbi:MAG: hypothetical protein R6U96_10140 [Promethearchaeia archaeon]